MKGLNDSMLIISNLKLPALPYVAPTTAISGCQNIDYITYTKSFRALWEGDLSLFKVYEGPLSYVKGSPLTLHNHFIQLYRALDTLYSKYHSLLILSVMLQDYQCSCDSKQQYVTAQYGSIILA